MKTLAPTNEVFADGKRFGKTNAELAILGITNATSGRSRFSSD